MHSEEWYKIQIEFMCGKIEPGETGEHAYNRIYDERAKRIEEVVKQLERERIEKERQREEREREEQEEREREEREKNA
ncbi:MAG: hypothetical protein LBV13_04885 [Methanomassiliicoccaceae archaeon]|nr:hypothetical protein [Methanomassiliicoccaceae archaeon]